MMYLSLERLGGKSGCREYLAGLPGLGIYRSPDFGKLRSCNFPKSGDTGKSSPIASTPESSDANRQRRAGRYARWRAVVPAGNIRIEEPMNPIPQTMQAWVIRGYGGAEAMRLENIAVPRPGPGELLRRVEVAGVNPADWKIRAGLLQEGPPP